VFITGASKGIGRATAAAFAKAGASYIAVGARSSLDDTVADIKKAASEANRKEPKILALTNDVTDQKSCEVAAAEISKEFGKLDILINNAGFMEKTVKVVEADPMEWWSVWEINVNGVFLTTRVILPILLKTEGGLKTILGISSLGALRTRPGAAAYQLTKMVVLRFAQFLDAEYGDQGLIAYGVHPGGVPTELASNADKELLSRLTDSPDLGANAMVWLTSEPRKWLQGRFVSVNWDMEEFLAMREEIEKGDLLKYRLRT